MKIKEIIEEKRFRPYRKYFRGLVTSQKFRTTFLVVAMIGLLCAGSFLYGTNSQNADIKALKKQLNEIHSKFEKEFSNRNLVKREIAESNSVIEAHHVIKRNPQDAMPTITATSRRGVTYTRWGRRDCPSVGGTTLVYTGIAATNHYTHTGGGSNILCLDLNVNYEDGKFVNGNQGSSYVYGVEYALSSALYGLFNLSQIEQSINLQNVPCSVCMATERINQLMIPANRVCPRGWTREYTGYIMSGAHSHKHSDSYICVDDTPQAVPGSEVSHPGSYLYMSETQCPSLQCEPFVTGRELRCVVCSI